MTTIKDATLIAFSIVDRVDRKYLLDTVNSYATSFAKNYIRNIDSLPNKNEVIPFVSDEKNDVRLTKYGYRLLNNILKETKKQKVSNQPNHNNLMWKFVLENTMQNGIPESIIRESTIKNGLITDLEIKYKDITLFIEAETGTQSCETVQTKINKYKNQLLPSEYLIIYSNQTNKLNNLILSDKIVVMDSNVKFDYKMPKNDTYELQKCVMIVNETEKVKWTSDFEDWLLLESR
jgi:hypothetical protein